MEARKGLRKSYHCLNCAKETATPQRTRARSTSFLTCPSCAHASLVWGTRDAFLQQCAKRGIEKADQNVGEMVGKALGHSRN